MGMIEVEALNMARRIAMFNSEAIYYVKNSLMLNTPSIQKRLDNAHEKFTILIKDSFPNAHINTLIANTTNNHNHDLLKLDVELIKESLLEGVKKEDGNKYLD